MSEIKSDAALRSASGAENLVTSPVGPCDDPQRDGVTRIADERKRQVHSEYWTEKHDDEHDSCQLSLAAMAYATPGIHLRVNQWPPPSVWPWEGDWWKPNKDPIRNLEKAGALIAAEIDRLLRLAGQCTYPLGAAEDSDWHKATRLCEQHLAAPDDNGCSCELHRILNEKLRASSPAGEPQVCQLCGHSLVNNQHGFDQNDGEMVGEELVHSGHCTYCRECNPEIFKPAPTAEQPQGSENVPGSEIDLVARAEPPATPKSFNLDFDLAKGPDTTAYQAGYIFGFYRGLWWAQQSGKEE